MPCAIRLLPIPKGAASFYDEDQFEKLVTAADGDVNATLIVLLGGEAGLRCGEMMALEWSDIDLQARRLCVARSEWKGQVTVPKGGRSRYVPMTERLAAALRRGRHLRGPRVLCDDAGGALTQKMVQTAMRRLARRAGVKPGVHILRHTFCSHLAMEGAAPRTIQEIAGHEDLSTTHRYMHLTRSAVDSAIDLLDRRNRRRRGDSGETSGVELVKSLA